MLRPGVVISDRYRLDARAATGGMGDVWRATDLVLGRTVALKALLPDLHGDPRFDARFRAESRIMAAVRHPGVVQVYDRGEWTNPEGERVSYTVMEYVEGEPLSARIAGGGTLPAAEVMAIVAQAARALDAVHAAGIVHRDVKPSNLMVRPDGSVVLLDFGVARSTAITSATVTGSGAVLGTALYMAPEQASRRPVTQATDVYALGAVAYHALAGRPPFTGDTPLAVVLKHVDEEPPELPEGVPEPVRAVVARTLAKDPAARYPTGAALAEAADAAAGGRTEAVTAAIAAAGTTAEMPAVGGRRRRAAAVAGAGIGAGALALAAVLLFTPDGDLPPADGTTTAPPAATTAGATGATQDGEQERPPANTQPSVAPATDEEEAEESQPATAPNPTTAAPDDPDTDGPEEEPTPSPPADTEAPDAPAGTGRPPG